MLANRLRKNRRRLKAWAKRESVSCFRLYDRDIPEVPLAVDWYEGRLHVAEYARPGTPEGEAHAPWLEALVAGAAEALGVTEDAVFLKRRERQRGEAQYERFAAQGARFEVGEGGHRFVVNLSDYLDTGLFLDHRPLRRRVQEEVAGRRFLNLFGYTGAFSVYAAAGGARSTATVDLSATYSDWAVENLRLNGFALPGQPEHRVVRADVDVWLQAQAPRSFDVTMVDPPTFSNSKRMQGVFDVQRDHVDLIRAVARLTAPRGTIYFSNNFRKFKLDEAALARVVRVEDISDETIPPDFRDRRIHRCWRLDVVGSS